MKKSIFYILAAVALFASCAKEVPTPAEPEPNVPEGGFVASFEVPNSTKTMFDAGTYNVLWDADDRIDINGCTYEASYVYPDRARAIFTPVDEVAVPNPDYIARYGSFDLKQQLYTPDHISNLPMICVTQENTLEFSNICAVLEMNIYEGASEVKVYRGESVIEENLIACAGTGSDSYKTNRIYVAVEPTKAPANPDQPIYLTIKANNKTMTTKAPVSLLANTIYPINFGTVKEITTEAYSLTLTDSDAGDVNVIVREGDYSAIDVTITDNGTKDRAIYVNAGKQTDIKSLTVNAPKAHVEVFNGDAVNASSITSASTLVVKPDFKITGTLTVSKGAVSVAEYKETKVPNVQKIEIPSTASNDIRISVAPIASTVADGNKVVVTNNKDGEGSVVDVLGTDNEIYVAHSRNITIVTPVASIGDQQYASLPEAIAAAKAGEIIKLVKDIEVSTAIEIAKNITLDLNGKTITNNVASNRLFRVGNATFKVIGTTARSKMSIPETNKTSFGFYDLRNNAGNADADAKLILEGGYYEGATAAGSFVRARAWNQTVELNNVKSNCTLGDGNTYSGWVNGNNMGFVNADGLGINLIVKGGEYIYNTRGNQCPVFHSYGAAFGNTVILEDAKVVSNKFAAIEVHGEITFKNCDFTVLDKDEQAFKSAAVTVAGYGEVTVDGGKYSAPYAVYALPTGGDVIINSGEFSATESLLMSHTADGYNVSITVNGGNFTYNGTGDAFKIQKSGSGSATIEIKGGTFNVNPSDYVAKGYEAKNNGDGTYTVEQQQEEETEGIKTQEEFVAACNNAKSGDIIILAEGNFSTSGLPQIDLTIKGSGENTVMEMGSNADGSQGTGIFVGDLTLENMSLTQNPVSTYTGFTGGRNLTFNSVIFNFGFSNWGNTDKCKISFTNCTFNQESTSSYCVQELRGGNGNSFIFDNCTFNSAGGRFVNAYKQGGSTASIEITVKDCTFSGESQSKAALNLKTDYADGCDITLYLLGTNYTNNVKNGSKTGNPLFDDNGAHGTVYEGATKDTVVKIWEKGAVVAAE